MGIGGLRVGCDVRRPPVGGVVCGGIYLLHAAGVTRFGCQVGEWVWGCRVEMVKRSR